MADKMKEKICAVAGTYNRKKLLGEDDVRLSENIGGARGFYEGVKRGEHNLMLRY